jgi:PAS domain S-box-containing protein
MTMAKRRKSVPPPEDLAALRRRLQEAEDTLDAIRSGHVEALIVRSGDTEEIFTLRSADQPFRLMVEQMHEGAMTLASDGTILYCNQRFAEMMAVPAERITGENLSQFVECNDLPKLRALLQAPAFRDELRLITAPGLANAAQVSSTALQIDGIRTVALVVTDLTHERIERGLRESNRLKDEFLATLSHELRTPLNVILGWTRMMLTTQLGDSAKRHALELIDRNAQAQAQLVNDLVDMSRMTTGKMRLDLEPLPLVPSLETSLESIRPSAQAKSITIRTDWKIGPEETVLADPTRLQQVLWNLLTNAVKFTPDGGRISITADTVRDRVRIVIADTGIGIDKTFLPHVFDRFRQAEGGTTRTYGGLGLGLAIVHDLVALHGGDITVDSEGIGRGSTFTVTLRTSEGPPRGVETRRRNRQAPSLKGRRVMLLEDHSDSRELFGQALESAGAEVWPFATVEAAFVALDRVRPSVIVADIGLPGEDGNSFIRRVRGHHVAAIRPVPAIAVTAYASPADRTAAVTAGFERHLSKPLDPADLVEAVYRLTRLHKGR